jgi:hypothetical protein
MHPRWFLLAVAPGNREYVGGLLATNRYRFEAHTDGFLIFARNVTGLAQWLIKQGIRIRTVSLPVEDAA